MNHPRVFREITSALFCHENTAVLRYFNRRYRRIFLDSAPLDGRTQLLQAPVMQQCNGRCRFQLNVTACVDD